MKKIFIVAAAALATLVACQKNEVAAPAADSVLYATIEETDATKTYMDANNNILWSEGDQIIGFMKSSLGLKYRILSSSVGKTSAFFEKVSSGNDYIGAGTEWDHNVVYYPYTDAIEASKSGSNYALDVVLPSEQSYASGSFGSGSMSMVAVSEDNDIIFRNVLGGIKLQLKGTQTVASISLEGKNNEKLSGTATVTAYTDETKPAITMAQAASTSVTLNCGTGVQLSENKATDFIIALPPVAFASGFTVTVTDSDGQTYTVETDKANTVLRSSLLVMPAFKLGNKPSDDESDNDELIIPVVTVSLNSTSLKLYEGDTAQLTATVKPKDATDQTVVWISDTPSVATVDQTGLVTALQPGTAKISAATGGKSATCTVEVSSAVVASADYIDEYGINHGKGIAIGMSIWAPVNCGYHAEDFKYGKLYQWGRKYGQGYDDSDASVPTIEEGGISIITGNHKSKSNVFFTGTSDYSYDWLYPQHGTLWNSGTESEPVKTEYDPCPDGWRVPTYAELNELRSNRSSWTSESDQEGYWFSGVATYTSEVPQVFFPAAGCRYCGDVDARLRGGKGCYWTSRPNNYSGSSYYLRFSSTYDRNFDNVYTDMYGYGYRAEGFSVRCVQE